MLDVANAAVEAATAAGADYADARAGRDETESLTVRNQEMEGIDRQRSTGLGIRVLVNGRWGFASTARVDDASIRATAALAVEYSARPSTARLERPPTGRPLTGLPAARQPVRKQH